MVSSATESSGLDLVCGRMVAEDEVARPRRPSRALDDVVLLQTTRPRPSVMNGGSLSCTATSVRDTGSACTAEGTKTSRAAEVAAVEESPLGCCLNGQSAADSPELVDSEVELCAVAGPSSGLSCSSSGCDEPAGPEGSGRRLSR